MPENNNEVEWLGGCFYCNRDATTKVKGQVVCQAHAEALAYIEARLQEKGE